jgi:quercetin dioxygenase-like cupin family protein
MDDAADTTRRTSTSGSSTRPARTLERSLDVIDLEVEAAALLGEPEWTDGDRNTRTLVATDSTRIALVALRGGASIGDDATDDSLALHVLRGRLQAEGEFDPRDLVAGEILVLDRPEGWRVRALEPSLIVLTTSLGTRSGS